MSKRWRLPSQLVNDEIFYQTLSSHKVLTRSQDLVSELCSLRPKIERTLRNPHLKVINSASIYYFELPDVRVLPVWVSLLYTLCGGEEITKM